jgi:hypothetical protein
MLDPSPAGGLTGSSLDCAFGWPAGSALGVMAGFCPWHAASYITKSVDSNTAAIQPHRLLIQNFIPASSRRKSLVCLFQTSDNYSLLSFATFDNFGPSR